MKHPDSLRLTKQAKRTDVWTVYGLVRCCKLIYIGCTRNPAQRLSTHRGENFPHHEVHMVVLATYADKAEALADEKTLIFMLDPECNRVTNSPKMWDREIWLDCLPRFSSDE